MKINNWEIFFHKFFSELYYNMIKDVAKIKEKNPETYKQNAKTKLLASIQFVIKKDVPIDPTHNKFRLGKTIGIEYKHWKRVKKNMPQRYRLFFRYHSNYKVKGISNSAKSIIYVWFNDQSSLRKKGDKNDCYNVFNKLLDGGKISDDWKKLLTESKQSN